MDNTSTGTTSSASVAFSHTTSGGNLLMLVGVSITKETGGVPAVSATSNYNGAALSLVGALSTSDDKARVEIWRLVAPATGTHTLTINLTGTPDAATVGAMTFTGVDQVTPLGAFASEEDDSGTASVNVNSAVNDLVFAALVLEANADEDLVPGAGQTERWDLWQDGTADTNGGGSTKAGSGGPVPMSWTFPADKWAIGGVSIKAAACPGGIVTTTIDSGPGSLRQCIIWANGNPGQDTITLPAGTYTLSIPGTGENAAATGDLDIIDALVINGAGAGSSIIQAGTNLTNGIDRVFDVIGAVNLTATGLTIRYGNVGGKGGGINIPGGAVLSLSDVAVNGNTSSDNGGGLFLKPGSATLVRVTFSNNSSGGMGGGAYAEDAILVMTDVTVTGNTSPGLGGGIFAKKVNSNSLTNVTIGGNSSTGSFGGGMYSEESSLALTNVTISGNSAVSGGGIYSKKDAPLALTNVTVANNSAATAAGIFNESGTVNFKNTILSNTSGGNCSGIMTSQGYNLDSANTCGFNQTGDIINTNPLLGALADNGGYTQTHALMAGSPAIDNATGSGAPATDQRGVARPQGPGYDIGAFEYEAPLTFSVSGTVFEDVNYGGGAGRDHASSSGVVRSGARVELFDGGGNYVTSATTDAGGGYSFAGLAAGIHTVRVVNSSVTSSRTGYVAGLWPVQTFRTDASSGSAVAVTDHVGGEVPSKVDAGDGSTTLAALTTATTAAQSISPVTIGGSNITGVDFGFNFDTIVNTNDSVQGSLRQLILNASVLNGDAGLSQDGRPAGVENAIFMIPDTDPNFSAGTNSFLIRPATPLPFIDRAVRLDASIQAGYDGTPVIDLDGSLAGAGANGFESDSGGSHFRGFAIRNFDGAGFSFSGSGPDAIVGNYIGTDVIGTAAQGNRVGIDLGGGADDTRVGGTAAGEGNLIAFNIEGGVRVTGTASRPIRGNSIYGNTGLGIDLGNDGVTPNNGSKNGGLPNSDMDYPVFDNAVLNATTLAVSGYVGSAPGQGTFANARVEIFKADNSPADQNGEIIAGDGLNVPHGEGRTYLGFVTADANGIFSDNVTVSGLVPGDYITATATDGIGNTSEFGANAQVKVLADLALAKTDAPDPAPSGGGLLYTLTVTNNGPSTAPGVTLTDTLPAGVTLQTATPSQGSCSGTGPVTCDLGGIADGNAVTVDILVVTSGTGTITNTASVTFAGVDPVPGNNSASVDTDVVLTSDIVDIPLTLYRRLHGFLDYTVTGGSLRTQSNTGNPCAVGASSTGTLSGIPATATVRAAYLYWAGSGSTVDSQITLDGTSLGADRTFTSRFTLGSNVYDFFGGFRDVTATVQAKRNGNYTFAGLSVSTGGQYCTSQAVLAGWSLMVVYEDSALSGKTFVLYDGFDLDRNSSNNYTLSGIYAVDPPEAKTSFLFWEGDENMGGGQEGLAFNATFQSDALNPVTNPYNSTINSLGLSTSYGVDVDTFDVSALVSEGDTSARTDASTGPDLVILNAVLLQVKTDIITGYVFEDVNYGGGAGRDLATAVAAAPGLTVPRPGAVVELYDAGGNFLRATTTDATGRYGFAGLPDGDYTVRVPNDNVTSSRAGATGNEKAVQTFRTDASSGAAVAVTNEVGGAAPALQDAPANTTSQDLGSFFAQSKAPARIITGITVTDVDFGFNFDTVVNTNNAGQGSLRQFITNANALSNTGIAQVGRPAGNESAIFMISNGTAAPGLRASLNYFSGGVATVSPTTTLPTIIDPVILDAQIQPGWTNAPILVLAGSAAAGSGLTITAGSSTVRGFVINGFSAAVSAGIWMSGTGGNTIEGNYVGTDASGASSVPNYHGIFLDDSDGNFIGGPVISQRNVISGNQWSGIRLQPDASGNTIRGNFVGVNAAGTAAISNHVGVYLLRAPNNTVGGSAPGEGNVVSGSLQIGIYLVLAEASGNVIQGNTIGLNAARTAQIPNASHGIEICCTGDAGSNNVIGGLAAGAANVISGSGRIGVHIQGGTGNGVLGNPVYGNAWLGIDLGNDNVTVNNGTKNGSLPNADMDFPVFTTVLLQGTTLTVSGYVGSAPGQSIFANARVEIFKSDNDASGYGEGQTYLGFLTADGSGNFTGSLTVSGLVAGDTITATATDVSNNTSEFGAYATAAAPGTRPDAMIKLASEGAGGYLTDDLYEATASAQSKPQGVVSGQAATYNVLLQNDGNITDNLVITGTASGSGFTVQYLDNTATDRTTDVTGSGYTIGSMAVGASAMWTVNVTPAGTVVGGTSYDVFVTAVSGTDNTKIDQVKAVSSSTSANLTLLKSADKANAAPGEDITYTVNASNDAGLSAADNVVVTDPIPADTGFKVGGATFNAGTSTLAFTVVYSGDDGSTWTYTPGSGGCGAPAGYDDCVTDVKWATTGSMPTGTNFSVGLVVRVK